MKKIFGNLFGNQENLVTIYILKKNEKINLKNKKKILNIFIFSILNKIRANERKVKKKKNNSILEQF